MCDESTIRLSLPHNLYAIVDADNAHLAEGHRWRVSPHGYVIRGGGRNRTPTVLLHRVVMGAIKGQEVDHINRDKLDNRRVNLRFVTRTQNTVNSQKRRTNTSGYKGVSWHTKDKRWRAFIRVNAKQIHIGHFDTAEEAARAYDDAAFAEWGEFAFLNFPDDPC